MTADSASASEMGKSYGQAAAAFGLDERECDSSDARAEFRAIPEEADSANQITQFAQAGVITGEASSTTEFRRDLTLDRIRSPLLGIVPRRPAQASQPPAERATLAWSGVFAAGRSSAIYVAHLKKSCLLLGLNAKWTKRAIGAFARGQQSLSDSSCNWWHRKVRKTSLHEYPLRAGRSCAEFYQSVSLSRGRGREPPRRRWRSG